MMRTVHEYADEAADETMIGPHLFGVQGGFDDADEYVNWEMDGDAGHQCLVRKTYEPNEMRQALRAAYNARRGDFYR